MVVGTDQRPVGRKRDCTGDLHHRKDQQPGSEAAAHSGVATENVGNEGTGRRQEQR